MKIKEINLLDVYSKLILFEECATLEEVADQYPGAWIEETENGFHITFNSEDLKIWECLKP